jgi:hypothetical protein
VRVVPDNQHLDGYVLAGHLGALERPYVVQFDVHGEPWSWRKDRYTPVELRELWARQLATPAVSKEYPYGLYVHVPFCTHSCAFCRCFRLQLHSGRSFLDRYVSYICDQIDFFAPVFAGRPLRYFSIGGGTPSILSPQQLARLLKRLHERFDVRRETPLTTIEVSLPTAHDSILDVVTEFDIPRVSMGVQTLQPEIRRRSSMFEIDARRLADRVEAVRARGRHCNLDLVLGLPDETARQFVAGFRTLLGLGPSSVIVNLLNDNYFHREVRSRSPGERAVAEAYLREAGEGMADAAARAGYHVYPHGNSIEAVVFFAPEFDRQAQAHHEVLQRLFGGVLSVKVGTSVFALGSLCNVALLPDYLIACHDQEYEFRPDEVAYRCERREVYSILYPHAEDRGPPFTAEQRAIVDPFVDLLRSSTKVAVMPSPEEVLIEFADEQQPDGRGRVFLLPYAEARGRGDRVGSFALVFNGELTPRTKRVVGAVRRWLVRAGADPGAEPGRR